jgi:hypothetical protein
LELRILRADDVRSEHTRRKNKQSDCGGSGAEDSHMASPPLTEVRDIKSMVLCPRQNDSKPIPANWLNKLLQNWT